MKIAYNQAIVERASIYDAIMLKLIDIDEKLLPQGIDSKTHLYNDLNYDSLKLISLFTKIEKLFGIDIFESNVDIVGIETIGDIVNIIANVLENPEED